MKGARRPRPALKQRRFRPPRVERGPMAEKWIDLLDPTEEELREQCPHQLEESAIELLLEAPRHDDEPRPTLRGHGTYVFGIFLLAQAVPDEDVIYYQQIGLVLTYDRLLTVRKTPPGGRPPYDPDTARAAVRNTDSPGMIMYRLVDDIAERYLDLVDDVDAEIDELEDRVESQAAATTRDRISELRHDLLHIRRTLAPMRDAVRRVVDDVVEVEEGEEVFPHDVEIAFGSAYDKLLRAFDGLEFSRDLLSSVRDFQQSQISIDQNEVSKRLTVIASLLLVPTFIVGVYGQNFVDIPELRWHFGYAFSWGLIIATTLVAALVLQAEELDLIRVFRIPFSTNVERVALAAGHKGLAIEWIDIDPDDRSAVEEASGQTLVPVLVDGDEVVTDSPAIIDWLERRFPDPPLFPADRVRRAEVRVFIDWFNGVWKHPPNAIALEEDASRIPELSAWMRQAVALFEDLLAGRDYLFGEFGAADVIAFPFLKYPVLGLPLGDDERFHEVLVEHQPLAADSPLRAWVARVDAHPRS